MSGRLRFGLCWAVLAAVLVSLTLEPVAPIAAAAEPQPSARALERVMAVQDRNTKRLMAIRGVVGTATGLNPAGQPVVKVFLAQAGVAGIPAKLEEVPVVVEVTGQFYALQATTDRWPRPVPIGISTGHPNITAGTIGCCVKDAGGNVYALSNNHVYADRNNASKGDNVLQPGAFDGGTDPADAIGTLYDFEPIDFSGGNNTIDAAIASSSTDLLGNATPAGGYGTPSSTTVEASLRLKVKKYGRTTGLTEGRVVGINASVNVSYGDVDGDEIDDIARFVGQVLLRPGSFSAGGDSGSLVVTQNGNHPVGLLFAGSALYTVSNPIDAVLQRFGVTVDDGAGEPPLPNNPPTADFTFDTSGLTATFTDQSTDSDGSVVAWDWDFGDGNSSTAPNPTHTYAAAGTYTVTLTVTDDDGAQSDPTSKDVTVQEPGGISVQRVDPGSGAPGQTLQVTITGEGFQDGATADFGDRIIVQGVTFHTSTELVAKIKIHRRAAPGARDVRVTNPAGSSGVLKGGFNVTP